MNLALNFALLMLIYASLRFVLDRFESSETLFSVWDIFFYISAVILLFKHLAISIRGFALLGGLMLIFLMGYKMIFARQSLRLLDFLSAVFALLFLTAVFLEVQDLTWLSGAFLLTFCSYSRQFKNESKTDDLLMTSLFSPFAGQEGAEKMLLKGTREGIAAINRHLRFEGLISDVMYRAFPDVFEGGAAVTAFFEPYSEEARQFQMALERYFEAEDIKSRQLAIEAFPKRLDKGSMAYKLHYAASDEGDYIYFFIEDQTEIQNLTSAFIMKEHQIEMIGEVLKNQNEFLELRRHFEHFVSEGLEAHFVQEKDFNSLFAALLHELHQFTVDFEKYRLFKTHEYLTALAKNLIEMKNRGKLEDISTLKEALKDFELESILDADLEVLRRHIPETLIDTKAVFVQPDLIHEIEEIAQGLPASKQRDTLLQCVWKIKYIEIGKLLKQYDHYAQMLAKRYGKKINPIQFTGSNPKIDEDRFKKLLRSIDQLIANSIEYGIESPQERFRLGKKEFGTISIELHVDANMIEIEYWDDGCGIDINALKESLYQNRYKNFDALVEMTDQEVLNCIFNEGVTTLQNSQHIGNGLYTLKRFIDSFGGKISVSSEVNQYTRFTIDIPNTSCVNYKQEKK